MMPQLALWKPRQRLAGLTSLLLSLLYVLYKRHRRKLQQAAFHDEANEAPGRTPELRDQPLEAIMPEVPISEMHRACADQVLAMHELPHAVVDEEIANLAAPAHAFRVVPDPEFPGRSHIALDSGAFLVVWSCVAVAFLTAVIVHNLFLGLLSVIFVVAMVLVISFGPPLSEAEALIGAGAFVDINAEASQALLQSLLKWLQEGVIVEGGRNSRVFVHRSNIGIFVEACAAEGHLASTSVAYMVEPFDASKGCRQQGPVRLYHYSPRAALGLGRLFSRPSDADVLEAAARLQSFMREALTMLPDECVANKDGRAKEQWQDGEVPCLKAAAPSGPDAEAAGDSGCGLSAGVIDEAWPVNGHHQEEQEDEVVPVSKLADACNESNGDSLRHRNARPADDDDEPQS